MERRRLRVSRSKIWYFCVSGTDKEETLKLQGDNVKRLHEFKYLRTTIQSN